MKLTPTRSVALAVMASVAIILVTSPSATCNPFLARAHVQQLFTMFPDLYREVMAGQLVPFQNMNGQSNIMPNNMRPNVIPGVQPNVVPAQGGNLPGPPAGFQYDSSGQLVPITNGG